MPIEPFDKKNDLNTQFKAKETNETSLKDITQLIMTKNEHKLPLLYNNSTTQLNREEEILLEEFIVNCLLDPSFVSFVSRVDHVLNDIVTKETNL